MGYNISKQSSEIRRRKFKDFQGVVIRQENKKEYVMQPAIQVIIKTRRWLKKGIQNGSDIMSFKPLPIGVDNFEKLITRGYYDIDKTLLIKELIDNKADVNLFTRPRRFGKTLNMSMLQYFFENSFKDNSYVTFQRMFNLL